MARKAPAPAVHIPVPPVTTDELVELHRTVTAVRTHRYFRPEPSDRDLWHVTMEGSLDTVIADLKREIGRRLACEVCGK